MQYIAPYRKIGSFSRLNCSIKLSAASPELYTINAKAIAIALIIFSCWVSCTYLIKSSIALSSLEPTIIKPTAIPAASPIIASSV